MFNPYNSYSWTSYLFSTLNTIKKIPKDIQYTYDCKLKKIREMLLTTLEHNQHDVIDVIWRLSVWNVKIRRYLASCKLQFWSNLTKILFQGKHFNYFIVVGGAMFFFWNDTHYVISLRYTRNIVQLNSFYIKFD